MSIKVTKNPSPPSCRTYPCLLLNDIGSVFYMVSSSIGIRLYLGSTTNANDIFSTSLETAGWREYQGSITLTNGR